MNYQSVNPNDGKLLKSFEHLSSAQLEQSLATAESCFQSWKHTSYAERAAILRRLETFAEITVARPAGIAAAQVLAARGQVLAARGQVLLRHEGDRVLVRKAVARLKPFGGDAA